MDIGKKAAMMKAFDAFTERITKRYEEAREALENGREAEAYAILCDLSMSHARVSLSLRNVLVREGKLEDQ